MGIRDTRVCNDNSPHLHRPSHPAEILFDGPVLTIEGFKQRECAHCGHATVHPCTAAGCSCLCPECGWDALHTDSRLGPCSSPICAHDLGAG